MFTEEMAIVMLRAKSEELGRLPKKDDFEGADVARIKSKLGPWNRALEAAGLKERKFQPKKKSPKRSQKEKKQ